MLALKWLALAGRVAQIRDMIGKLSGSEPLTPRVLEYRLVEFGAGVCFAVRKMRMDVIGTHISRQLVRSATSSAANYAEARAAESRRDFVHKMQICLKELRETSVWLRFSVRLGDQRDSVAELAEECSQLIAIFVRSVNTARNTKTRR